MNVVEENSYVILETRSGHQKIVKIAEGESHRIKRWGVDLHLEKCIGLEFNRWYSVIEGSGFQEEMDNFLDGQNLEVSLVQGDAPGDHSSANNDDRDRCEHTIRKYRRKKENMKRKSIRLLRITPYTLLSIYKTKKHKEISYIGHPELAYLSLQLEQGKKALVLDGIKGLFLFTIMFKGIDVDLTAVVRNRDTKIDILKYLDTKTEIHQLGLYDKIDGEFDLVFIVGNYDLDDVIKAYRQNMGGRVFVYSYLREQADETFRFLIKDEEFVGVGMMDFFCREYQAAENIHPLVRGEMGSGYVVSAIKVQK
jgi:hypothetical protein